VQEGENAKTWYKFSNDVKMCFEHKTRMNIDNKIKDIKNCVKLCFYHVDCDFLSSIFCHEFSMFEYAHIFSL
jgi:hypothetical protein